jgi:DNA sulfur modification protein DndD
MNAQLGAALAGKIEERDVLDQDLAKHKQDIEQRKGERASLEEALRKQERFISLLDKREALERRGADLDQGIKDKRDKIADRMGDAWRPLVQARANAVLTELRREEKELERREIQRDTLELAGADDTSECPACLQPIGADARDHLRHTVEKSKGEAQAEHERLLHLRSVTASLDGLNRSDHGDVLRMLWADLRGLEQERYVVGEDVKELNSDLRNADETSVRQLQSQSEGILKDIAILEAGVQKTGERLETVRRDIVGLRDKLAAQGGSSLERERRMLELADQVYKLFDAGVAVYRERLRERVEADATDLFRRLTTEPEFVSLQINKSYGLSIVHADGDVVTVRSAGAEHVVALCLMGALQRNAPLRGPIVIDSPFGRLDRKHTENIVKALPVMAPEVVLLVYEDELRPDLARQYLGTHLRAEYKLTRVNARHTDLERVE